VPVTGVATIPASIRLRATTSKRNEMGTEVKEKSELDTLVREVRSELARNERIEMLAGELCTALGVGHRMDVAERLELAVKQMQGRRPVAEGSINEKGKPFVSSLPAMRELTPGWYDLFAVLRKKS